MCVPAGGALKSEVIGAVGLMSEISDEFHDATSSSRWITFDALANLHPFFHVRDDSTLSASRLSLKPWLYLMLSLRSTSLVSHHRAKHNLLPFGH